MNLAKDHGLMGVEFHSNLDSIKTAIEEAKTFIRSKHEEKRISARYRKIIDSTSEDIIAVDRQGLIQIINQAAMNHLNTQEGHAKGKQITEYLSNTTIREVMKNQTPEENNLSRVRDDYFVFDSQPIFVGSQVIGGLVTFKNVSNVRETEKYTSTESTVLITGETGTGKEILAHSIHNLSIRRKGPFVSINCAAIPDQLLESELFGYAEGAFTGSRRGGKPGLFELAHTGTLFLDETGAMPQQVQTRLLRVLQERDVMRVGGDRLIPVDIRIIAATNQNLNEKVAHGKFREDLFFRLNILKLNIPPLRERVEDMPVLVEALIDRFSRIHKKEAFKISSDDLNKLMRLPWPGNVRQLANFVEQMLVLSDGGFNPHLFDELYSELFEASFPEERIQNPQESIGQYIQSKMKESEAQIIKRLLEQTNNNKTKAAKVLEISRTTLWRKMKSI